MSARRKSRGQHVADWIVHHPRLFAWLRLGGFGLSLLALAIVGAVRSAAVVPVYYDPAQRCEYNAVEADPPPAADRVPVNQEFVIAWRFANTGSCGTWTGVKLVRRNDAVQGAVSSYSVGSPVNDPFLPPALAGLGSVQATVVLTAPAQVGIYVTEWQLHSADNQPFGPVMVRQIQVFAPDAPPTQFAVNPPRPDLFGWLRVGVSLGFYALPALLATAFVVWRAVQFMNALYGLKPPASSLRQVVALLFGIRTPYVSVSEGRLDHEPESAAAEVIGGPAWLTVADFNAAVIERGGGFSRVVGPGITFLLPHERVRGAIDLHTQHRTVREKVMTKDGIPVEVDVELGFRITDRVMPGDADHIPPPALSLTTRLKKRLGVHVNPALLEASREHAFSFEAVRRAVYESAVLTPDRTPDWAFSFANVRAGDISDQLVEMRLDEILAPDSADHPLREVPRIGVETARKVAENQQLGIDVTDMAMGTVDLPKEHEGLVSKQRLASWRAEWNRRAVVLDAQGKAKILQLTEEARAESQANMIQALTEGFRIATEANPKLSHEVMALRFIDTLEALMQGSAEKDRGKEKGPKDKPPDMNLAHLA
ncbi:MAG: hypothetical protein HY870_20925 [Chloroflexi bacterium]|nr:hypothetical protein [Chloroflexota bacterium]